MKKISNIYGRLHSPESKLQKRKRKLKTQIEQVEDINIKKLQIQITGCLKKQVVSLTCQENTSLKQVKTLINQRLKKLKLNTEQLIGFETDNHDYAFDYRFQVGIGKLDRSIKLSCLYFCNQRGLQKYKICCCLAIGGFSKVFLVRSRINGSFFAAKFIDKQKKQLINNILLENQKQISLRISSPFLVKTQQFIQTDQFYVFVMDYCPGGQLFYLLKKIKRMTESEARICFIQVLLGIQHLHNAGFMYRDLKPQNILLDAYGYMKIADFGLSKPYFQKSYSFCGSVQYMAPQIIVGKGHKKYVDFYCLGALLYQILVGHPPFYDSRLTSDETKKRILYEQITFPDYCMISRQAKDLITKLTQKNERQRLGYFSGCKQIMAHPWIGKIDRKKFEEKLVQVPFPVDLTKLNFDPEQIGQSQRAFQIRINRQISGSKNKKDNKQKSEPKQKCHSQKFQKLNKSPHKNKSLMLNSYQLKEIRMSKSPYENAIKSSLSLKKLKHEKSQQKTTIKKNYIDCVRHTQAQCLSKQNKMIQAASKLRKRCKYIALLTNAGINQNQKGSQNIRRKNNLLTSYHFS